jgi:ATP-dependent Clp protease ATP-binding subunit ClpA
MPGRLPPPPATYCLEFDPPESPALQELLYRFDMSEFLHLDQVKLFVGDESGQTGRLGTVLSQHRQGILLFGEIEKAHNLIWDLFLQMIGDARITLADHKTYDLSGFYIVCNLVWKLVQLILSILLRAVPF